MANTLCTIAKVTIGVLFGIAVLTIYALAMAASWSDDEMGYDDRETINPDDDRVIVDDDHDID